MVNQSVIVGRGLDVEGGERKLRQEARLLLRGGGQPLFVSGK